MTEPQTNPTERHRHTSSRHMFHCHGPNCGVAFPHEPGVGLFHSKACEKAHTRMMKRLAGKLIEKGFRRNKEAPNVFTKSGVSITLEQVKFHGLKDTIKAHEAAVRRS